jgi:hypothetical protein
MNTGLLVPPSHAEAALAVPTRGPVELANVFLGLLSPEQRKLAVFPMDSPARIDWHFIPRDRPGLALKDLDEAGKAGIWDLLGTCLSPIGIEQVKGVMRLEQVLLNIEKSATRDPGKYQICIWGEPNANGLWGWRFEGHHCSLNVDLDGNKITGLTPAFFGANPAKVLEGEWVNFRNLPLEEDLGYEFLSALGKEQREKAHLPGEPEEVLGAQKASLEPLLDKGLPVRELDQGRKELFLKLLEAYTDWFRADLVVGFNRTPEEILKDPEMVFQWQGGMEKGAAWSYRISGHSVDIQFNNRQNNRNHVHTLVCFPGLDFGGR